MIFSIVQGKSNFIAVWRQNKSNNKCLHDCLFFVVYDFSYIKSDVYKTFAWERNGWLWKSSIRMFSKLWQCQTVWYLFASFKTIILCSLHSMRFMKYVFSAKIWFVKTSTRVVKYELEVIKSNPATYDDETRKIYSCWSYQKWQCKNLLKVFIW